MKGTAARGASPEADDALASGLVADEKNRAENLMIVDLLRNDLGRVARPGSVRVPRLFHAERYPTVTQMTSTVAADLAPEAGLSGVIRALFPCGSVTGAPKLRAMEIIREIESGPRGVYCGAIGYAAPAASGGLGARPSMCPSAPPCCAARAADTTSGAASCGTPMPRASGPSAGSKRDRSPISPLAIRLWRHD